MLLAAVWRQEAFRKFAKWLFGGPVVAVMPGREQLEGHVGFNRSSKGPSWPQDGQRWSQDGP